MFTFSSDFGQARAVGGPGLGLQQPAARAPKKTALHRPKMRRRRKMETYSAYVYKVLKQVHPELGISKKAMVIMCDFTNDMFIRLAEEANTLAELNKKVTVSAREIQSAVRLCIPGELAKHAVSEGTKAVTKWHSGNDDHGSNATMSSSDVQAAIRLSLPAELAKLAVSEGTKTAPNYNGTGRKGRGSRPVSKSARAGLQFPVGRIHRYLKQRLRCRIGSGAPVYLAAVLEYLVAEVLELAGNASRDLMVKRITPRHLLLAFRGDVELDTLIHDTAIADGGVIPHIHKALLNKPACSPFQPCV
mmetsp:Transcript_838/g.3061  ORF Transcript_838/g.3061 Transcript_838/m.3061 type:complete len:303 (+) Transcript_838:20-928(+)